jgi:hypothetical protein
MANNIYLIYEYCQTTSFEDIRIIKEQKEYPGAWSNKNNIIIFETKLQTAEEVNGNNRWYPIETIDLIIEGLSPKAKTRSLYQEINHPFIETNDENIIKKRAINIDLNNCGSLVRSIRKDGNSVIAEVETLAGFKGPDLRDIITINKANIGFSLRMFGKLQPHSQMKTVMEVVSPLRPITYDVVTEPSHKGSRIMKFLTESDNFSYLIKSNDFSEMELTQESLSFITENNMNVSYNSKQELTKFLDDVLAHEFLNMSPLTFKID